MARLLQIERLRRGELLSDAPSLVSRILLGPTRAVIIFTTISVDLHAEVLGDLALLAKIFVQHERVIAVGGSAVNREVLVLVCRRARHF